jgi:F0F1-type ATP synthase assembly protein I
MEIRSVFVEGTMADKPDLLRGAYRFTHLGLTMAVSILLGFFGGNWADGKLGTSPLFVLIGAFGGAIGGFIYLIRQVTQFQQNDEKDSKDDSNDQ